MEVVAQLQVQEGQGLLMQTKDRAVERHLEPHTAILLRQQTSPNLAAQAALEEVELERLMQPQTEAMGVAATHGIKLVALKDLQIQEQTQVEETAIQLHQLAFYSQALAAEVVEEELALLEAVAGQVASLLLEEAEVAVREVERPRVLVAMAEQAWQSSQLISNYELRSN